MPIPNYDRPTSFSKFHPPEACTTDEEAKRVILFEKDAEKGVGRIIFNRPEKRNSIPLQSCARIADLLGELQFRYVDDIEVRRAAVAEHEEILDAVWAHDGFRARAAMENHLRNAVGRVVFSE